MAHGTARKLTRAAALSLLVFATTSGVAGLEVLAASPAMAEPSQGSPFDPGQDQRPSDPAQQGSPAQQGGSGTGHEQQPSNPGDAGGLLGGLTGGGGGLLGGGSGGSGGSSH